MLFSGLFLSLFLPVCHNDWHSTAFYSPFTISLCNSNIAWQAVNLVWRHFPSTVISSQTVLPGLVIFMRITSMFLSCFTRISVIRILKKCNCLQQINFCLCSQEVEREISFRTECGLYYSYFKQMLQAPSVQQGIHSSWGFRFKHHL